MDKKIKIILIKSKAGVRQKHINTLKALGLGKINSFVLQNASPSVLGMINQVSYLLKVEEVKTS